MNWNIIVIIIISIVVGGVMGDFHRKRWEKRKKDNEI